MKIGFIFIGLLMIHFGAFAQSISIPSACAQLDPTSLRTTLCIEGQKQMDLINGIDSALDSFQSISTIKEGADDITVKLEQAEANVGLITNSLEENMLRIEFLESFIPKIEASSQPRKDSLSILKNLARNQLVSATRNGLSSKLWLFEIYLSIAIRDHLEPNKNLRNFVEEYMNYSSTVAPKNPLEFAKQRSYSH